MKYHGLNNHTLEAYSRLQIKAIVVSLVTVTVVPHAHKENSDLGLGPQVKDVELECLVCAESLWTR